MTLRFLTAGESHGPGLTLILDGIPAGLKLDMDAVQRELARRQQGVGSGPRMKIERDRAQLVAGLMAGQTTGAPLAFWLPNRDHEKWRGRPVPPFTTPRPGHVDLAAALKYGYVDLRPGLERASARETAARVLAGAVCKQLLACFGVQVGGYVAAIGEVTARLDAIPLEERPARAERSPVRCPDEAASRAMEDEIRAAMQARDTLGGVIEVLALGLPPGLGAYAQWDRRLDARLGAALLSVQAIKGVEIGEAFANARRRGTQAQDPVHLAPNGALLRPSWRNGGLEGGLTTGQPLLLRAAMKPIASTLTPQATVDLVQAQPTTTTYERSDFCPVPRAVPVLEAMTAFVLADALLEKLGGDSLDEMKPRFAALRRPHLDALSLDGQPHSWWPATM